MNHSITYFKQSFANLNTAFHVSPVATKSVPSAHEYSLPTVFSLLSPVTCVIYNRWESTIFYMIPDVIGLLLLTVS